MVSKSIPILVTGQTRHVGAAVIAAFKPDFEGILPAISPPNIMIKIWEPLKALTVNAAVIHFTLIDSCTKEIPLLLKGEVPSSPSGQLGSGNWSGFPKAILFGGGYTDKDIAAVRNAVAEVEGAKKNPVAPSRCHQACSSSGAGLRCGHCIESQGRTEEA